MWQGAPMNKAGMLFGFSLALVLAACASQGPVPPPAPAAAVAAPVAPAADTAAAPIENGTNAALTASSAAAPAGSASGQGVAIVSNRHNATRRVVKDGVEYFCERPPPTGSHFIAEKEQCYTEAQLKAIRER